MTLCYRIFCEEAKQSAWASKRRREKQRNTTQMSGQAVPVSSETQTNLNSVSNVCTSVPMNDVSVSTSTMVSVSDTTVGNSGSSEVPDLGRLIKKPNTTSTHWKNFKVYENNHSKVRMWPVI